MHERPQRGETRGLSDVRRGLDAALQALKRVPITLGRRHRAWRLPAGRVFMVQLVTRPPRPSGYDRHMRKRILAWVHGPVGGNAVELTPSSHGGRQGWGRATGGEASDLTRPRPNPDAGDFNA